MFKSGKSISGLRGITILLCILFLLSSSSTRAQNRWISEIHWTNLMDGLQYAELDAPEKAVVNDSKLSILKIDAQKLEFRFLTASEHGKTMRTAPEWASEFDQNVIINAGMYSYNRTHSNKGYMKNFKHVNNPARNDYYNALLAMHPKDQKKPPFEILDTYQKDWDHIKNQYNSVCQGMRMINDQGEGMPFTKRPDQSCSMVLTATDAEGNIYIIFTRSPYTHRTMIAFLKGLPIDVRTTVYLEGGPEASFYVNTGDTVIAKYGSYVSNTCDNDDNDHFWNIPNVIAIRKKK
jgi:hypothetical protein